MTDLITTLKSAVDIARRAGQVVLQGWGQVGGIDYKGEVDLVTDYDRRSEALIVDALSQAFPHHAIHAEEEGVVNHSQSPYLWLIDPLDGTTNFAHGFPVFAVSLGLLHQGVPVVGVIYDPTRDECFAASQGGGVTLNGRPIQVSPTPNLDTALLATGFSYDRRTRPDNNVGLLARFIRRCQGLRRAGAAALDLAYVACGRLDGFWELRLHPWDLAAGVLLVQEAGGRVSDLAGGPNDLSGQEILASNGQIHQQMLEVLARGDFPVMPDA
jgi:myo-inositol-1(or 4)-monophosphatase